MTRTLIGLLVIANVLLQSACSSHSTMTHPQVSSEEVFIAEMIPHHQEAVDTARLVLESDNQAVRALAEGIISAQESEIKMMTEWLDKWYPSSMHHAKYENMMPDLLSLKGQLRDEAFLKGMIDHHEGAIEMAKQAQELELRPEVLELTNAIITTQQEEIKLIETLLK